MAHRPEVKLEGIDGVRRHLVRYERREGRAPDRGDAATTAAPSTSWRCPRRSTTPRPATNAEFDTTTLRFTYTSLVTPGIGLRRGPRHRRAHPAEDHRGPRRPRSRRLRDGAPLGHRRRRHPGADLLRAPGGTRPRRHGTVPPVRLRLLRGVHRPVFSTLRLSLLDRGFVFAIAHVRGGGELGRPWYDDGKLLHKRNTFTDFIAVRRAPGGRGADRPAAPRRTRRVGRRPPHGRDHQPASRPLRGRGRRGALRRLPRRRSSTSPCR